jgi:TRAP-type C4-dicarboxylate transport system permease small subunit
MQDHGPRDFALEDWLGVVLLVAILGVMAIGIFFRYALNDSLTWTEEVARYGLVLITYVGCATAVRRGTHIRVDAIDLVLSDRARRALALTIELGYLAYMAWRAIEIIGFLRTRRSPALELPIGWIYGAIAAGFALAALRLALALARRAR